MAQLSSCIAAASGCKILVCVCAAGKSGETQVAKLCSVLAFPAELETQPMMFPYVLQDFYICFKARDHHVLSLTPLDR